MINPGKENHSDCFCHRVPAKIGVWFIIALPRCNLIFVCSSSYVFLPGHVPTILNPPRATHPGPFAVALRGVRWCSEQKAAAACDGAEILEGTGPGDQQSLGTSAWDEQINRGFWRTHRTFGTFFSVISWQLGGHGIFCILLSPSSVQSYVA